jgi:hypothetical protein
MYTETIEEAIKIFNQIRYDIENCFELKEVYVVSNLEYYVRIKDSRERIYIEEIK